MTKEKILRTAPELERLILNELSTAAICAAVTAVTVVPVEQPDTNWGLAHISVPGGGPAPQVCVDSCAAAVKRLRAEYDLLLEIEVGEL